MDASHQITRAREILENKWGAEGDCASCGWRALLAEVIDGNGVLKLSCLSKDDEDRWGSSRYFHYFN